MQLEEMKMGFFGYQKSAVQQYLANQEAEFSKQLQEKDAQAEQAVQQAKKRIEELEQASADNWARVHRLEQELQSLQAELDGLRQQEAMVADTLLDAQTYAQQIRENSQIQEAQVQEQLRAALDRDFGRLEDYRMKILTLRRALQGTLREFDQRAERLEQQMEDLSHASPAQNLTLLHFQDGVEPEE